MILFHSRPEDAAHHVEVVLSRPKQHRGSVYCLGFNPTGELLATGSNDKTLRLMAFNTEHCKIGALLYIKLCKTLYKRVGLIIYSFFRNQTLDSISGNDKLVLEATD